MELQQLKYFCEVAKREHVTRTAEKLFVSQSAISRAVTQLEGELGVPLFYRQGRAVVLSPYGRLFLEHVSQALSILEDGKRLLSEQTGEESGSVSLGFLHSLGIEMVPRLIKEYRRKHPRIQFTLLVQRSGEMLMKTECVYRQKRLAVTPDYQFCREILPAKARSSSADRL